MTVATFTLRPGYEISRVICGGWQFSDGHSGVDRATGVDTLAAYAEAGIFTFDCADIYTGVEDHIVRRFDLAVSFTVPAPAGDVLKGLSGGSLHLDATLTDLGKPQTIAPPANAQPSSRLLNGIFDLESQFGSLAGLFAPSGGSFGAVLHVRRASS